MGTYHIRRVVEPKDIYFRTDCVDSSQLPYIRAGLKKLHTFEIMAVNIYKFQITKQQNELNQLIIQAMANEMTHVQDFQTKLYEYNARPSIMRWTFWLAGMVIGLASRLLGRNSMVKAGIWTEQKAVTDYQKIIDSTVWDPDTLAVIKRNLGDEHHHIETLQSLLRN